RDDNHELPLMKRYPLLALVIVAAAGLVFIKIREDLGEMELPVLVYTIVITTMSITALNRQAKTSRASFAMVMAGALLFMTSDSLIAWDRFHGTIDLASVWIMLTYIAAQGLIVYGLMAGRKADFEGSTTDA
ncbi:MAG: lysoplasmalogenase, partial [Flavobacteriales bacterium]|nr:lysoplasmalogenase [Flavobacteriales bacterium]